MLIFFQEVFSKQDLWLSVIVEQLYWFTRMNLGYQEYNPKQSFTPLSLLTGMDLKGSDLFIYLYFIFSLASKRLSLRLHSKSTFI